MDTEFVPRTWVLLVFFVSRRISSLSFHRIVVLLFVRRQSFAIVATFISISIIVTVATQRMHNHCSLL